MARHLIVLDLGGNHSKLILHSLALVLMIANTIGDDENLQDKKCFSERIKGP